MKKLEFTSKSTNEIYLDYIRRVERMTKTLPEKDCQDILMELNSHIYEHMQQNTTTDEVENMLEILKRLGAPEEALVPLIADKKLGQATKSFNPVHIVKALSLNIANGISYVIFGLLYLFLACFSLLIFAKLFFPKNVGLFYDESGFKAFGMAPGMSDNPLVREVLGFWFIPLMLLVVISLYVIITLLLKLKYKLKK